MVSLFSLAMLLFTVEYCFDMLEMDYMEMLFVDRLWMVKIITRHYKAGSNEQLISTTYA